MDDQMTYAWVEDNFEGRYRIVLTIDTGRADALLALLKRVDEWAPTLKPEAIGYQVDIISLLSSRERAAL